MATLVRVHPRFLRNVDGDEPLMLGSFSSTVGGGEQPYYREVASQTYGVGAWVYHDTNGATAIVTDSSGVVTSVIAGAAQKAATGVTSAPVMIHAVRPAERWLMNVYHATAASAVTNHNQLGDRFGLIIISGKIHVDIENTTVEDATTASARVQVTGFYTDWWFDTSGNHIKVAIGDIYGLVEVKPLQLSIATDGDPRAFVLQHG